MNDVSALSELKMLDYLGLEETQVSDLSSLNRLHNLTRIDLGRPQVRDLSPLVGLKTLKVIGLYGDDEIEVPESLAGTIWRHKPFPRKKLNAKETMELPSTSADSPSMLASRSHS